MDYIQIVEYQSTNIDAIRDLARDRRYDHGDARPMSILILKDRDRPDTYATMLRFSSYEDAMRHSEAASTHELLEQLAPYMTGERRFYNLDVIDGGQP